MTNLASFARKLLRIVLIVIMEQSNCKISRLNIFEFSEMTYTDR